MTDHPGSGLGVLIAKMDALTERVAEARDELKETRSELTKVKDQLQQTSFELTQTKNELTITKGELAAAKTEIESLKKMIGHYRSGVAAILGLGGLVGWLLAMVSGVSGVFKSWVH
jgi:chromosome segregation ATPase